MVQERKGKDCVVMVRAGDYSHDRFEQEEFYAARVGRSSGDD